MGTLVCTVELNKALGSGVKVTIDNEGDGITQTIQMDGTRVTITVQKKGSDPTTYTQTATDVTIACETFAVTASKTITMTSKLASTYQSSDDALTVQAQKDVTLKSSTTDLVGSAANNVKVTGQSQATVGIPGHQIDLAPGGATLSSSAQVTVKGAMVAVKADGMLTAEASGVASFKGAITNIQGNLVNLG